MYIISRGLALFNDRYNILPVDIKYIDSLTFRDFCRFQQADIRRNSLSAHYHSSNGYRLRNGEQFEIFRIA